VKAWRVAELGEPRDAMSLDEIPDPQPGAGQLLVRVLGAAANFADALICRCLYQVKPPLPFTPGLELCGLHWGLYTKNNPALVRACHADGLQRLADGTTVGRVAYVS
jgi:hypothetical protein